MPGGNDALGSRPLAHEYPRQDGRPGDGSGIDLTEHEQAILAALASGTARSAVASALSISEDAIDAAVTSALEKLHRISSRASEPDS